MSRFLGVRNAAYSVLAALERQRPNTGLQASTALAGGVRTAQARATIARHLRCPACVTKRSDSSTLGLRLTLDPSLVPPQGRVRAWLRRSLNAGSLHQHLQAISASEEASEA